ncbi:hypothetical protein EJD97_001646 [Solanum chilense]|uniref:Uncharacterized protein n=1 Tax=Solanum chilense TaxID=4083 RepID=A0A6N2AP68_SOLCI|nr:hypothetical protein EJD97_001646 [Solanum chilense]
MVARRVDERRVNEEIPPQVKQVEQVLKDGHVQQCAQFPIVGGGNDVPVVPTDMSSGEIRDALLALAQDMTIMNEMSRFVSSVGDLLKEECHATMLHNDMSFSRIIVYAQCINEAKHSRMKRKFRRNGSNKKSQYRFKKRAPNHDGPSSPKVKFYKDGCFQEAKEVPPNDLHGKVQLKNLLCAMRDKRTNPGYDDDVADFNSGKLAETTEPTTDRHRHDGPSQGLVSIYLGIMKLGTENRLSGNCDGPAVRAVTATTDRRELPLQNTSTFENLVQGTSL